MRQLNNSESKYTKLLHARLKRSTIKMRITFETKEVGNCSTKEEYEWIRTWCEKTNNKDLPRILLLGDSITEGYYPVVRDMLKGKAYVDYLATSYSIDTSFYQHSIENFVKDSTYDVVHFNHGLHGSHMTQDVYKRCLEKVICEINIYAPVILTTTTSVLDENMLTEQKTWKGKIKERNSAVYEIAEKYNLFVDDLHSVSEKISLEKRNKDGVHFQIEGYNLLANSVVESIQYVFDNTDK